MITFGEFILDYRDGAIIPKYKTLKSSGADLTYIGDSVHIFPHETRKLTTGVWVKDYAPGDIQTELQLRGRSSLGLSGLMIPNGVATIDSDYRGELFVVLTNTSTVSIKIRKGERIAQLIHAPVLQLSSLPVDKTVREGGFGSTGNGLSDDTSALFQGTILQGGKL